MKAEPEERDQVPTPPPVLCLWFGTGVDPNTGARWPAKIMEGREDGRPMVGLYFLPPGSKIRAACESRRVNGDSLEPAPPLELLQRLRRRGIVR